MLDLPGHPVIDKTTLVGGCLRLPVRIDAQRLAAGDRGIAGDVVGLRPEAASAFIATPRLCFFAVTRRPKEHCRSRIASRWRYCPMRARSSRS